MFEVMVQPGHGYTLSLSCRNYRGPFKAALYDRWPFAAQARRVELPMGPLVRTQRRAVEYRWQLGISPRSAGSTLYVVLDKARGASGCGSAYTLSVLDPPAQPSNLVGQGITYLQGPGDLVLAADLPQVAYVVARNSVAEPPGAPALPRLPIPGDLVRNTAFADGLNHWQPHRDYEPSQAVDTVSLHGEGLRLRSAESKEREGVMQTLDADVTDAKSLLLRAEVRVTRQAEGGTGVSGRGAPVALSVCYVDANGAEHCREQAFWQGFYSIAPEKPEYAANGRKVPAGRWYRFQTDLMQLDPKPKLIRYISLEGAGWPEREAWVREVHLIKRGDKT